MITTTIKEWRRDRLVRHEIDGITQPLGDEAPPKSGAAFPRMQSNPVPFLEWPLWAKALKLIAKSKDKGIGDVVYRTIGPENSEAFKKWYKATTGKDCGCTGRQALWNRQYPLK